MVTSRERSPHFSQESPVMNYGDYLGLESLLACQAPRSDAHDEMLLIVQHQTSELWMKLVVHELQAATAAMAGDELPTACKMLARVSRVFEQLTGAWDVLRTMTPSEYIHFRQQLGSSSGFQSHQYRAIEFILGNRNLAKLNAHAGSDLHTAELTTIMAQPSLYDEAIASLARAGFDVGRAPIAESHNTGHLATEEIVLAWSIVYRDPTSHWQFYELAEKLVDLEDHFRRWRFSHLTTVERIIGFKRGTGGSSGLPYLRKMMDVVLFPELWSLRTHL